MGCYRENLLNTGPHGARVSTSEVQNSKVRESQCWATAGLRGVWPRRRNAPATDTGVILKHVVRKMRDLDKQSFGG